MSQDTAIKAMQSLRNIGPVCARDLVAAGIDSPEKLKELGAQEAFLKLCLHTKKFCFNAAYLYALEGAIKNCDWRAIPENKKIEFKAFTAKLREEF